ncbi:MAG: hypothetical protein HN979_07105 [Actinobacteria bacterium]|jgi:hypothetical protein|nr:hypothetical protein [Actinomycetota bacterium]MBT3687937.1 hypothetical protein [Actinomycetota bacterium]MBT4036660.1 hypothetical protein [Actinomycetota bacterium]MBT4278601.1 hypothetical protein [Actinomycetota bacterium]MBT4342509.1 hypothetical protein [Actinomycetota bacterium]
MPRVKLSDQEKAENKSVRDFLDAIDANRPKRGRKRTVESISDRMAAIEASLSDASATKRLTLVQERLDLQAEIEALASAGSVDMTSLEASFVNAAAAYGGRRGISYAAWREVGVSTATLKAAGIRRST